MHTLTRRVLRAPGLALALLLALSACEDSGGTGSRTSFVGRLKEGLRPPVDGTADLVLGQVSTGFNAPNLTTAEGVYYPNGIALDTSVSPARLYVADTNNNRVLGWADANGFVNGDPATLVVGQATMNGSQCNQGASSAGQATLCSPAGVAVDSSGNLYVADSTNNRVLLFNSPFTTDTTADRVFGQSGYSARSCNGGGSAATASSLCYPTDLTLDGAGALWVVDQSNHRALKYNPPLTDTAADVVLGQSDFVARGRNRVDGQGLAYPWRVAVDRSSTPNRLYVADYNNSRVLGWSNATGFTSGAPANLVIGQADFAQNLCNRGTGAGQNTLCYPAGLAVDASGNLFVADYNNSRVLEFNTPFTSDGLADKVYGQPNYTQTGCYSPSATTLCYPYGVAVSPTTGTFWVADSSNNRVLGFTGGAGGDTTADIVFGQAGSFNSNTSNNGGVSATSLSYPLGLTFDGSGNLYVADQSNSRVLAYLTTPSLDATADVVYGQLGSFTTNLYNSGGLSASSLAYPYDVSVDGLGNLWVADASNYRVLGFSTPLVDTVADRVLGKPNFTTQYCFPVSSSCTYYSTPGVAADGSGNVFVADSSNNRVLLFNTPFSTDSVADKVLGQADFTATGENGLDGLGFNAPYGVAVDTSSTPNRLWIADYSNGRVLGWSTTAVTNGQGADKVVGKANFATAGCSSGSAGLCYPYGLAVAQGNLYVADRNNSRVLEYDAPYGSGDTTADRALGQTSATSGTSCNRGQVTASADSLCYPRSVAVDSAQNVWVSDSDNSRILRYATPWTTDIAADSELGQAGFVQKGANRIEAGGLYYPRGVAIDRSVTPNRIYVADTSNQRVLGWPDVTAFVNGAPASLVIGQVDAQTAGCNNPTLGPSSLCDPYDVAVSSTGRLYVADRNNSRVLAYDSPFTTDTVADQVLGQPNFTSSSSNQGLGTPSASTLYYPSGLAVDPSGNVWVSDAYNHRVLEYVTPATTDAVADLVLGQASFTVRSANRGGTANVNTLNYPHGLAWDSSATPGRLYVADRSNNRVLAFQDPTVDGDADQVFGQPNFTSTSAYYGGNNRLYYAQGVAVDRLGNVYVSDYYPSRVLEFDSPRTTDALADAVFGQSDMNQTGCNNPSSQVTASTVCQPLGLDFDSSNNMYLADYQNNRVTVYFANNRPTATPVAVAPLSAYTDANLSGSYAYADADADPESGTVITWYKNGAAQAVAGLTVSASLTTRGDSWYFTVRPKDGIDFGPVATSNTVVILNSLPAASSQAITPSPARTADILNASYGFSDLDGDTEAGSIIRWYRNGLLQSAYNDSRTVPSAGTTKGDLWYFTVAPGDGVGTGTQVTSPTIAIANTPPTASSLAINPASPQTGNGLTASYVFADADSDTEAGSEIRWYENGALKPAYNNLPSVPGSDVQFGEAWYYTLRPRDGTDYGATTYTSPTVTVGSTAPTASGLNITPSPAYRASTLQRNYTYSDPDSNPETGSQTRWYRNGSLQSAYNDLATVAGPLTKNDVWYFTIRPCDSTAQCGTTQTSPSITVQNTAPTASGLGLAPASPFTTSVLSATWAYSDPDGDAQNGTTVRWYRNGVEQTALVGLTSIAASYTSKGENWWFTVTPRDGTAFGTTETSPTRTIANSAPVASAAVLSPSSPVATSTLSAAWGYADADGDPQVGTEVRWYVNGSEDGTLLNAVSVPPSKLARGQTWYFRVKPKDNVVFGTEIQSNSVVVANSAPVATNPSISPALPPAGSPLVGSYSYNDADNDPQTGSEIKWYRDGIEMTAYDGATTVPSGVTKKGEKWRFTVRPNDGLIYGAPATSPEVTIANTAPTASSVAVSPSQPRTDDPLVAGYSFADADGDSEVGSELKWFKNGSEQSALTGLRTVPAAQTTRGETWYFTLRPSDGTDFGALSTSAPVTILNTAPVASNVNISPLSPKTTDAITGSYTYSDADGDLQQGSEIRWYKDTVEQAAYFNLLQVPAGVPKAGETWYFTVRPRDGVAFGTLVTSTSVVVGSSAPVATALQVTPFTPRGADALTANYLYSDPDGQAESGSEIKWFADGTEVLAVAGLRTVPAMTARKGEVWHFTVRPNDGTTFGATQTSPTVTILNTPPVVANPAIAPSTPRTTDVLSAQFQYSDLDLDVESGTEIRWYRNGLEQASLLNSRTVPASVTRKNEVWYYRVRPNDGSDYGAAEISTPAFIANSAPVADAGPDQSLNPTRATVRVALDGTGTQDADQDILSYTWTEGANVLGTGAQVSVDLPLGPHTITLTVSDGEDTSTDTVQVDIANPKPTAQVPADFEAPPGRVVLAGTGTENLGRTLTYAWTQLSGEAVALDDADQATASFFALKAGPRTFQFVVYADGTPSDPQAVTVTVRNEAPWAQAQPRRVVAVGMAAPLDGARSADPNADPLSFAWSLDAEGLQSATLSDPAGAQPTLTASADGRYVLRLVVNDGALDSAPALGEVLALDPAVTQHPPVANAGPDQHGEVGRTFSLDGRGSYDADGDALSYTWRRLSGPAGELTRANTATPSFRAANAGALVLGLVVGDGKTTSVEDTVTVDVTDPAVNGRPVARATGDGVANVGQTVQLDATRSTDPDGDTLTFQWSQVDGPKVAFSSDTVARPTFTALRAGQVRVQVVVSDGTLVSAPALVTVVVTNAPNRPPLAAAGPDQAVIVGGDVTLDGSGSADPDGDTLTFVWEQLGGPPVVLGGTPDRPTFTPPGLGRYRFHLVVYDAEAPSAPDEVEVVVSTHGANNQAPVANAGPGQEVAVGDTVTLDGSLSADPDPLDRLTYDWTFVAFPTGAEPALDNVAIAGPSFQAGAPGSYTLRLVVTDGDLSSAPSYVTVIALSTAGRRGCGCGEAPGGASALAGLLLLAFAARRARPAPARVRARGAGRNLALLLGAALALQAGPAGAAAPKKKAAAGKKAGKTQAKKKPAAKKAAPAAPAATETAPEPEAAAPRAPTPSDAPRVEGTAAPAAEGATNPYLDEARQMYANFQLEGLISKLEFALAVKGTSEDQKVEIFKLMAFTHASFDDVAKTEEAFVRLLEVRPRYELQGASPKIRQSFAAAQRLFRERQAVKLQHAPPRASATGASTTVDVVATSGAERVSQMMLHYRPEGAEAGYSQTEMQAGEAGAFSAVVPNIFPGPAGRRKIEYFVRARDKGGALLASVGDESNPLLVEVDTVEAVARVTPVYKTGWFWGVLGGVVVAGVAAGVATPLLLKKDAAPPGGSLGTERLP